MSDGSARVELLTAEVRALMIGKRQVTLSVYRQLDRVSADSIEPFGRVRDNQDNWRTYLIKSRVIDSRTEAREGVHVVGRDHETGALVRASTWDRRVREGAPPYPAAAQDAWCREWIEPDPRHVEWLRLPLIVLAGLR